MSLYWMHAVVNDVDIVLAVSKMFWGTLQATLVPHQNAYLPKKG